LAIDCGATVGGITIGANSFVNQATLAVSNGETLTINGPWRNAAGATLRSVGATLNLGDQQHSSTNAWTNAGTLTATDSTVNLGGQFTLVGLGTFQRTGGAVNLVGTLDNTGRTLALDASTGSWNLLGGTVLGGTYAASGGAALLFTSSGGILDGVTAQTDLDLRSNAGAFAQVQ